MATDADLATFLTALGDDRLILGHRLSEWCGHAPVLEEELALANIALDLIGQSVLFLRKAGELEGRNRSEDTLAFLRSPGEYRNLLLAEQENGDFGRTIARHYLFGAFSVPLLELLANAQAREVSEISAKALKEDQYHLRHTREWMLRLGDGTEESNRRLQCGIDDLWQFTQELFEIPPFERALIARGAIPDLAPVQTAWEAEILKTFEAARIVRPTSKPRHTGGRLGNHTDELTSLLSVMQELPRRYPGATW